MAGWTKSLFATNCAQDDLHRRRRIIVAATPDIIVAATPDLNGLYPSPAFEKYLCYSLHHIRGPINWNNYGDLWFESFNSIAHSDAIFIL